MGPECNARDTGGEPLTDTEEAELNPDQPNTFDFSQQPEQLYTTEHINRVLELNKGKRNISLTHCFPVKAKEEVDMETGWI